LFSARNFFASLITRSMVELWWSAVNTVTGIALQSALSRPESVSKLCVAWRSVSRSRGSTRQRSEPSFQPALTIFAACGSDITCTTPSTFAMCQAKRSIFSIAL
jgi:hypothetical protein